MRKTLRELGFTIGKMKIGPKNSLTDICDVKVGHVTLNKRFDNNEAITTGVTAILPHSRNLFYEKVPAASFVLNGFGKTTGLVQVEELGVIEGPIMLTNTFSVPAVTEGALLYMFEKNEEIGEKDGTVNIVVGECNDSFLNDIRGLHVRPTHAIDAIKKASHDKVIEGAVGAGTGMTCFGFKGGIGSSSRIVDVLDNTYTVAALVLSNFGLTQELTIFGKPIGQQLKEINSDKPDDGSIIIIIGTDAPLDSRQLKRLSKRALLGLGRTGAIAHNGSGDIVIAFSNGLVIPHRATTGFNQMKLIDDNLLTLFFQAVVESVEEAILNSIFMAETTIGRKDRIRYGIPIEKALQILNNNY